MRLTVAYDGESESLPAGDQSSHLTSTVLSMLHHSDIVNKGGAGWSLTAWGIVTISVW